MVGHPFGVRRSAGYNRSAVFTFYARFDGLQRYRRFTKRRNRTEGIFLTAQYLLSYLTGRQYWCAGGTFAF